MTRTQQQIEHTRMRDAAIVVRGRDGAPRAGLCASIEQTAHEFPFGCLAAEQSELPDSERVRYAARLAEVFNATVSPESLAVRDPRSILDVSREPLHLARLRSRLDRLAETGVWVVVSGRTVSAARGTAPPASCDALSPAQPPVTGDERGWACRVADLFTLCFAHPAVSGLVWRGFSDREPDVPTGLGLLRADLAPRHAHRVLRKLIHVEWHTRHAGTTGRDGRVAFRGFCGDYRVVVGPDLQAPAAAIAHVRLSRATGAPHEFELDVPS